ncbi:MAG TPA: hypothetical protein VNZ61_08775 [Roseomonas sp.]|nr:hypothetical protein [Roseomonas sp.]
MAGVSKPAEAGASAQEDAVKAPSPALKTVRFTRSHRLWNRGVEAGFAASQADELIALGVAVQIYPPVQRQPATAGMVRK